MLIQNQYQSSKPLSSSNPKIRAMISEIDKALAAQQLQTAEDLAKKLCLIDPTPGTSIKLAHLMFIQKKFLGAEKIYKEILPIASQQLKAEVLFGLGQVYFELKAYSDCHMAFSMICNSYPNYEYINLIHLKLAKILIASQEFTAAGGFLNKILEKTNIGITLRAETLVLMAHIKEEQGEKAESFEFTRKAAGIIKNFRTVTCLGFKFLQDKPEFTEKICKRVLCKARPADEWSDFFFLRALANIKLGDHQKAKMWLEDQVKAFPLNYLYAELLGIVYLKMGEKLRALEVFQGLRVMCSNDVCNLKNLAFAYKSCGYREEAWHVLEAANGIEGRECKLGDLELQELRINILTFPTNQQ